MVEEYKMISFPELECERVQSNEQPNVIAPQNAIGQDQADGGTIYLSFGDYGLASSIHSELDNSPTRRGWLRVADASGAAFVQTDDENLRIVTKSDRESGFATLRLDRLRFSGNVQALNG
jgi:hypothetical protein